MSMRLKCTIFVNFIDITSTAAVFFKIPKSVYHRAHRCFGKTREIRCQILDNNSLSVNGWQSEIWHLISDVFLNGRGCYQYACVLLFWQASGLFADVSAQKINISPGIVEVSDTQLRFVDTVIDGERRVFPASWHAKKGADGETLIFPPGWNTAEGVDGRLIAYPSDWSYKTDRRGHATAGPGWKIFIRERWVKKRADINCRSPYPDLHCMIWVREKEEVPAAELLEGADGRIVLRPMGADTMRETDGGFVVLPREWNVYVSDAGDMAPLPPGWRGEMHGQTIKMFPQTQPDAAFDVLLPQENNFALVFNRYPERTELIKLLLQKDKKIALEYALYLKLNEHVIED
jgi:hypothetical protein